MSRLFVIGDSFSASPKKGDETKNWCRLLAERLHQETGRDITLINNSLVGTSQEWCWTHLQIWLNYEMTADDYLVICLTHPSRVWFLDHMPEMTNANIIDLDRWVTKEEAKAIELYIRYIQRPMIDLMNVNNRLAYVAYQTQRRSLRKPLIIKCFDQDLDQAVEFPELLIAQGSLMSDVQYHEFDDPEAERENRFWRGIDCRYNHLCLSNHEILVQKLLDSFVSGQALDLQSGFHRALLKPGALDDIEFCQRELDMQTRKNNLENTDKFKPIIPWAKRVGVKTGQIDA